VNRQLTVRDVRSTLRQGVLLRFLVGLVGLVALAVTPLVAQTPAGEIAGRMSDEQTTVMGGRPRQNRER
jgi:hypothetical protein